MHTHAELACTNATRKQRLMREAQDFSHRSNGVTVTIIILVNVVEFASTTGKITLLYRNSFDVSKGRQERGHTKSLALYMADEDYVSTI
jgi:hypothetical protein